jgi:hypothetical protein
MAKIVGNLDQSNKRIPINKFELENEIVFEFFDKKVPAEERDKTFLRALYIGVLALMEDRLSSFLDKTSNELGTELESLKKIFDMKQEIFFKTAVKGTLAEEEFAEALKNYLESRNINDYISLSGNKKAQGSNKTGDIICEIDASGGKTIAIECKLNKNVKLGDIKNYDAFTKTKDTAWSQLIEADYNRESNCSIIVFDRALVDGSITSFTDNVAYIPQVGFVVIVDSQAGNYTNLAIAYMLARNIAIHSKQVQYDKDLLAIIITRIVKDIKEIQNIKTMVEHNIQNNKTILAMLEKSMLIVDFNQKYLEKFLKDGTLTKEDLLKFYQGEDMSSKYQAIEKEIEKTY